MTTLTPDEMKDLREKAEERTQIRDEAEASLDEGLVNIDGFRVYNLLNDFDRLLSSHDHWQTRAETAEREAERMRLALEPFAAMADAYDPVEEDEEYMAAWDKRPTLGELRAARAALAHPAPERRNEEEG